MTAKQKKLRQTYNKPAFGQGGVLGVTMGREKLSHCFILYQRGGRMGGRFDALFITH